MSPLLHTITVRAALAAGILTLSTSAMAQTPAVVYQGLKHTAIGDALLRLDERRNALEVTTADPDGRDGVAVHLKDTTTDWTAQTALVTDGLPLTSTLQAFAEGQSISSAVLRQMNDRFALSARFTGARTSTYAVLVYDQGTLVASLGAVPPTAQVYIPFRMPCEFFDHGCGFIPRFRNHQNGECEWAFTFPRAGRITLPDGRRITGTEVRLVEELHPAGHYPYLSFDGVTLQTTARRLTLLSERAR